MKIYVDADACPVKEIIVALGKEYGIPVIMVFSLSHYTSFENHVEEIVVDNVPQAADMAIVNRVEKGDILVTQDYGLASLVLNRGVRALNHLGKPFTHQNMDSLLFQRHLSEKMRRSGRRLKGPKAFTKEDQERFKQSFIKILSE